MVIDPTIANKKLNKEDKTRLIVIENNMRRKIERGQRAFPLELLGCNNDEGLVNIIIKDCRKAGWRSTVVVHRDNALGDYIWVKE